MKIKYFIEHKETHLWWYPENDYSRPNYITTFNGSKLRVPGFKHKDGWTNDPNHFMLGYNSIEEAEHMLDVYPDEPHENLIITRTRFC